MKKAATIALLIACIGILQYHAIQFWSAHVDAVTGWAWSLTLEGAALFLWSSRHRGRWGLGAVASVLLLAGPLYHVSEPLVQEWQNRDHGAAATTARAEHLQAEIASLETALGQYLANSGKRVGWAGRIDETQARLDEARAEQAALIAARAESPTHTEWQATAIIALQAAAIVLLQLVAVMCIHDLRRAIAASENTTAHAPHRAKANREIKSRQGPFAVAATVPLRQVSA